MAVTKKTTFTESDISISDNNSDLEITIEFSAGNSTTYFTDKTLKCTCNGETKTALVTHKKGGSVTKSFTFYNIEHNADGSKSVDWSWSCATSTQVLGTIKSSGTKTLSTIPRKANVTGADNFNDTQIPIVYYNNPAGYSADEVAACLAWDSNNIVVDYRPINRGSDSYAFQFTEEERNALRRQCDSGNSRSIRFYIRTKLGDNYYYSSVERTFSIINANPSIDHYELIDVNSVTTNLTKDNEAYIKGYSTLRIREIQYSLKKQAQFNRLIVNSGDTQQSTYNSSVRTFDWENVNSNDGYVEIVDKRNNSSRINFKLNEYSSRSEFIEYSPIKFDYTLKRMDNYPEDGGQEDPTGTATSISLSGNIWNKKFGSNSSAVKNSIKNIKIEYRLQNEDTRHDITSLNTTIVNAIENSVDSNTGNFSIQNIRVIGTESTERPDPELEGSTIKAGFKREESYYIIITITDELQAVEYTVALNEAKPHIEVREDDDGLVVDFKCKIKENNEYIQTKPVVAYSNGSGTTGTIILSYDASKYNHMRVSYLYEGNEFSSDTFSNIDNIGGYYWLSCGSCSDDDRYNYIHHCLLNVNGKTVTLSRNNAVGFDKEEDTVYTPSGDNNIYVQKIELWN